MPRTGTPLPQLLRVALLALGALAGAGAGAGARAGAGAGAGAAAGPKAKPKQLRWYVDSPDRVVSFLGPNGTNPGHFLNTSVAVGDVSHGFYQCCNGFTITADGTVASDSGNASEWKKVNLKMMTFVFKMMNFVYN